MPSSFRVGAGVFDITWQPRLHSPSPGHPRCEDRWSSDIAAHLPPLIDQPAFGPVRIANELRKRGLISPAGSQTKCLAILVAPVGPREPARLGGLTAFLMAKPGAYPKLDGNGAWWCVLKTTPVLGKAPKTNSEIGTTRLARARARGVGTRGGGSASGLPVPRRQLPVGHGTTAPPPRPPPAQVMLE